MNAPVNLARLEENAAALVDAALKAGADSCDVVVSRGQSLGIGVREGKVENTNRSESDDFSLRVFCGKRVASVNANNIKDIDSLAQRAVAMAKVSPEDPFQGLAPAERLAGSVPDLDLCDTRVPDAAELTQRALECEAAGLSVEGVTKSMGASAGWGLSGFVLATSTGFSGHYSVSRFSASAAMVSGEGTSMERDYDYHSATHGEDLMDSAAIGRSAGERAVRRRNPRQVASAAVPVIFDRRISGGLLGSLLGAINGAAVARKTSFLRDRMGQPVANPAVTVIDEPLRRRGLGSRPVDGEGMATAPLTLVADGVLREWLLDWAAARELGLESNARATRGGSGTSPSSTNCHIAAGEASLAELLGSVKSGLYLTETIGHGINMVTGDYSKGASGFWIENGEITWPVAEITIAGNLKDMFASMIPASDLEFRYATNAPTLFVEGMTVGGK
ncbi:MAG: TldD/PmbA family protein [Nitratireductor sp.]|nr:TldD/PmbA family protein [Nitratireductor sp.]